MIKPELNSPPKFAKTHACHLEISANRRPPAENEKAPASVIVLRRYLTKTFDMLYFGYGLFVLGQEGIDHDEKQRRQQREINADLRGMQLQITFGSCP